MPLRYWPDSSPVCCVATMIRPGCVSLGRPLRRTARVRLRRLATSGLGRKPCQDGACDASLRRAMRNPGKSYRPTTLFLQPASRLHHQDATVQWFQVEQEPPKQGAVNDKIDSTAAAPQLSGKPSDPMSDRGGANLKLHLDRRTSERPNVARLLPLDSVARGFKFLSRMGQPGWGATKLS